ncbi:hypothetical protein WJX75_001976 [Coccomyxa subellipsoidea]|uniref:Apple domain-containing protein n=1 Tax=Coccomyxa subellipsoidea TaxID=248742 RepID=A0ABR2YVF7_9CHLO
MLKTTAFFVLLGLGQQATADLFNFSNAAAVWSLGAEKPPSAQACSNLQLLLQYQNTTDQLGAILLKSIGQNQSYAVAEAVRFALIPNSNFSAPDPSLMPAYQTLASNIGAATAYAMHYARQQDYPAGTSPAPPYVGSTILQTAHDPSVAVQPNASDVFNAVAVGAVAAVVSRCDGNWRCHTMDCNTPLMVMDKRAETCCGVVAPLLRGIKRQLSLFGETYLLGDALSPAATAQDVYNLGFLDRCLWYPDDMSIRDAPAACKANKSANYMGKVVQLDINSQTPGAPVVATAADCCAACVANPQCNIWVFCGSQYGCGGCDYKTINYDATLGNDPSKRFGPYGPGCTQSTATLPSFFPIGTCTLKYASFTDKPPAYDNPAAGDFISGHLVQHIPRCNN